MSTSKYEGCLLFKEFGLPIDSNTIDVEEKTSVNIHSLGQEADSGAPFHCVIAPEVARRFSQGTGNSAGTGVSAATPIMECCKPSTCQSRFKDIIRRQFLRGIPVDHYLIDFVPDRKKRQWHIEIITMNELLDTNGVGYSVSKLHNFQLKRGITMSPGMR